ncbi:septum formation initiator family protein [Algicella marina]|uniref:Septum formation initiator family protein n=2 Tax=Algicella marina TaxID=2683284 RepID=A0A6P1T6G4_9RHOB|nr:septum formation initiator family protein [Algicella marina]
MQAQSNSSGILMIGFSAFVVAMVCYFTYAAIQGNFGMFRQMQVEAQEELLLRELAGLQAEKALIANKTRRLSIEYLDLDLLDEQARKVLGLARGDEIIIR